MLLGKIHLVFLIMLQFTFSNLTLAQNVEKDVKILDANRRFSISVYGDYISSAELQPNPNSLDPIERDATIDINGTYGFGAELNYQPSINHLDLIFYVSSEYMKFIQNDLGMILNDSTDVSVGEQFTIVPIEFGVKWHLPVSSDYWKIYIGGGGGLYFGKETKTVLNLQSSLISSKPDFSLNILSGIDYFFDKNLSANFELKFREAAFDSKSRFPTDILYVNGTQFQLQNPFYSKFIADGVRISLGFKYYF